jgi:hypothetical protein
LSDQHQQHTKHRRPALHPSPRDVTHANPDVTHLDPWRALPFGDELDGVFARLEAHHAVLTFTPRRLVLQHTAVMPRFQTPPDRVRVELRRASDLCERHLATQPRPRHELDDDVKQHSEL